MFWSKKNKSTKYSRDSITVMTEEAQRQGWLEELSFIPELQNIYTQASNHFFNVINNAESHMRETLVFHTVKYLFAKGVEGVILWGYAPKGQISVYFHPKHLVGDIETEVPKHLHHLVIDSLPIGESLFKAHQSYIIQNQKTVNLEDEIKKTLQWIPHFGITYGIYKKYNFLGYAQNSSEK